MDRGAWRAAICGVTESDATEGLSTPGTALAHREVHTVRLRGLLLTGAEVTVWSGAISWAGALRHALLEAAEVSEAQPRFPAER